MPTLKPIAFLFPQFHRVKENDAWWGEGFTEWNNVRSGTPQFPGHAQPLEPLWGYYDYDQSPRFLEQQCAVASEFGLYGFCLYHYWFSGRRLLTKPLELYRENSSIRFPFCVCWANDPWVRSWVGKPNEILIEQRYPPEDPARFIRDLLEVFRDERYIEVHGKKLLLIYRTDVIPDIRTTTEIWRRTAKEGGVELYLVCGDTYARRDPRELGFDATYEFPPLDFGVTDAAATPRASAGFQGNIYSYGAGTRRLMAKDYDYSVFRGIMPSWDNTARMGRRATIFHGSSPELYQRWLRHVCDWTMRRKPEGERIFFINAWNEWGEGCCLEPDSRHGYAYLKATREILRAPASPAPRTQTLSGGAR